MRPYGFSKFFISFLGISFKFSDTYASFEIPTEVRHLVRSHGREPFKRGRQSAVVQRENDVYKISIC